MQFESVDLEVSDCDSKEEADKELQSWCEEVVAPYKQAKNRQAQKLGETPRQDIKDNDLPF